MSISSFERFPLLFGPSPVHRLERLTAHLGGADLWAKREDCNSGIAYGGNKTRKLEYLVADALAQGCDTLVSIGGVQSNHTRQVAAVAARVGLKCVLEFGIAIPLGSKRVVPMVQALLEDAESGLPDSVRPSLNEARAEILELERRMRTVEHQLRALARQTPVVRRLRSIPGVGLITATALIAFVGDVWRFPSARHFASYLGLTPRERSSGLRRQLGAISKRGDVYIRMLLTHGARAVLWKAKSRREPDRLRAWALAVERLRGHNKAAIALANKLARIVWAVWRRDVEFIQQAPAAS